MAHGKSSLTEALPVRPPKHRSSSKYCPSELFAAPPVLLHCQADRDAPCTPRVALIFEDACDFVAAKPTTSIFYIPFAEFVPVALDQKLTATGTPSAAAIPVVHVPSVNVLKPFRAGDLACTRERGRR